MKKIGIICEYNPFHNGHDYHIKQIKERFKDSMIICVMSGNFVERGEVSIINKWEKTKIALEHGIDLVVELPFAFSSQSADLFCKGSIQILNALKVDAIVFGSETNDIALLNKLAEISFTEKYQAIVKEYIQKGNNYPTAMALAFHHFGHQNPLGPNDTLALGYIKELKALNSSIEPIAIQRTNDYHSKKANDEIASATAIRLLLKEGKEVSSFVPYPINKKELHFNEEYFPYLKYKIITEKKLNIYQSVDEGIENRIKKYILEANSFEELIQKIKTKRYTYHKLSRMFIHILTNFTKEEAKDMKELQYIRVLGFNKKGKDYLKQVKKDCSIPILSKFEPYPMLLLEQRVSLIYDGSLEYKMKPIVKAEK